MKHINLEDVRTMVKALRDCVTVTTCDKCPSREYCHGELDVMQNEKIAGMLEAQAARIAELEAKNAQLAIERGME